MRVSLRAYTEELKDNSGFLSKKYVTDSYFLVRADHHLVRSQTMTTYGKIQIFFFFLELMEDQNLL